MVGSVAENTPTVVNLLAAFEGESNAHARYVAFASQANLEGWHGAASLFCAAAFAEQVHANNHARVIKQMGGEAHCVIHPVEIKTTIENLKTALAGEQHEIDTMYPEFINEATASANSPALRSFKWAMEAEKSHAALYREAITLVGAADKTSWLSAPRNFYVCAVCGYTSDTPEEHEYCPVCNLAWGKFEVIR